MNINDLRNKYSSKDLENIHDYYRSIPLNEKDKFEDSLLDIATTFADTEALKILAEREADLNEVNRNGNRPLHNLFLNIFNNDMEKILSCTELLLNNGASILRKNEIGETPVLLAVRKNYLEVLELFSKRNLKMNLRDNYGNNALHVLVQSYDKQKEDRIIKMMKILLDADVEPNAMNDNDSTPAEMVLRDKKINPILISILKGEYDFDNPDNLRNLTNAMSLTTAILSKRYDIIEAHLNLGTDVNEISEEKNNSYNLTPLGTACYIFDLKSVELLLKHGADPNYKNNKGETALSKWFTYNGSIYFSFEEVKNDIVNKIMLLLIEHGLNINNTVDNEENTLLIKALYRGSLVNGKSIGGEVIKILLKNKVNINASNIEGKTALMKICQSAYRDEIDNVIELLENGADVSAVDKNGYTVLMYAAQNGENEVALEIAKLLYDFGDTKTNYVNNDGQSVMDIAIADNKESFVNWLLTKI